MWSSVVNLINLRDIPQKQARFVYIAGKITGDPHYKTKFRRAERRLRRMGFSVLNPAWLPKGTEYESAMDICFSMIRAADAVVMLPDWRESKGAVREKLYADGLKKGVYVWEKH